MKALSFNVILLYLILLITSFTNSFSRAQGVLILDGSDGTYLPIVHSDVSANVLDQVGTFTCSQTFYNPYALDTTGVYAFALPEHAAAIRIDYQINGVWYEAVFSGTEQDTLLPGEDSTSLSSDQTAYNISHFLGSTPLYFRFNLQIPAHSTVIFNTQFVELLAYQSNVVSYQLPGNYADLGLMQIDTMRYTCSVQSQREILDIGLYGQSTTLANGTLTDAYHGLISYMQYSFNTEDPLILEYELADNQMGLMDFSSLLSDSLDPCDAFGRGYLGLILEPDGGETQVVDKDFILILDRSGSMDGNGLSNALQAAHYVLDHLNPNDRFNIVTFENLAQAHAPGLLASSAGNIASAHSYLNSITAMGGTNISSSFDLSIPMFANSPSNRAKVIVFLTDGQANIGVISTPELVAHVNSLVSAAGLAYDFSLFCFGVDGANEQLLNQLADQNNGEAFYTNSSSFSSMMNDFYNSIQNPVLLNAQLSFDPPLVSHVYPEHLSNLYLGQQLIVFGRYETPGPVQVTLSGVNHGNPVSYSYQLNLADSTQNAYAFLPKMWAKEYIDHQMSQYYAQNSIYGPEADSIRALIVQTSVCNEVLSPFTSFQQGTGISTGTDELETGSDQIRIFPNPFDDHVMIDLELFAGREVNIRVFDLFGKLVYETASQGADQLSWDGRMLNGAVIGSGIYLLQLSVGDQVLTARIQKR